MIQFTTGIKWHDVACHHEKPIICEDEPGHLRYFSKVNTDIYSIMVFINITITIIIFTTNTELMF